MFKCFVFDGNLSILGNEYLSMGMHTISTYRFPHNNPVYETAKDTDV